MKITPKTAPSDSRISVRNVNGRERRDKTTSGVSVSKSSILVIGIQALISCSVVPLFVWQYNKTADNHITVIDDIVLPAIECPEIDTLLLDYSACPRGLQDCGKCGDLVEEFITSMNADASNTDLPDGLLAPLDPVGSAPIAIKGQTPFYKTWWYWIFPQETQSPTSSPTSSPTQCAPDPAGGCDYENYERWDGTDCVSY